MARAECAALYMGGSHLPRGLKGDGLKTSGGVFLRNGFSAGDEVRLLNADIGSNLDCAGGRFSSPSRGRKKYALNAERVKTGGHVYLNKRSSDGLDKPFFADGRVRFANADIGVNFNCKGGRFRHLGEGSAIAAGGLKARGAVFLSDKFSVQGDVDLHVARIGNFVCRKCDPASKGVINLASTKAVAVDDDKESWDLFKFRLDGFTYDTFFGEDIPKDKSRCDWLAQRDGDFSPLPYEQAAKVLFEMGHNSDAREILLAKERLQTADERTPPFRKFWRGLWDAFAGYGYRLRKTAWWMVFFVLFGAILFDFADKQGRMVPHQPVVVADAKYKAAASPACAEFKCPSEKRPTAIVARMFPGYPAFIYSVDVFIPFFALHQEPYWYPKPADADRDIALWILPLWYWLEIGFGWILTSLFLLSVTGVLRPRQSSGEKG